MQFTRSGTLKARGTADILLVPFWNEGKQPEPAADLGPFLSLCHAPISTGDFTGKKDQVLCVYVQGQKEKRWLLVGLGKSGDVTLESLRRAYSAAVKACHKLKVTTANVLLPDVLTPEDVVRASTEGMTLTNYTFEELKGENKEPKTLIKRTNLIGVTERQLVVAKECLVVTDAVFLARDLINRNADDTTPQYLGKIAQQIARAHRKKVTATVFNKKRIESEKMGLLLAVGRGGSCDPAFIILEYRGNPGSSDKTVLVGKGIVFDTGGLNIKPTGGMENMKCDMSGAAAVLSAVKAAAALDLQVNVTAVVPSCENGVDSLSFKPGDVYKSYSGKTVEIGNTDAEGRLILADALAYTCAKLKPTRIIDIATLTGAKVIALGEEAAGLMSNNDELAAAVFEAGQDTHERVWRLPLYEEYRSHLDSYIADISSTGGRSAGAITAAYFLKEFVGNTPWAHLDIAGSAFLEKELRYNPREATGFGVRLFVQLLKNLS